LTTAKVSADRTLEDIKKRRGDRWNFLFIAGMWFQDLFNYDFRRTEQCIIPYATQEGEISFCAYNTGVGWRNIIEKMHMTSTLTKWYEEHGRHESFAGGKNVGLEKESSYDLVLNDLHVQSAATIRSTRAASPKTHAREDSRSRPEAEDRRRKLQDGGALSQGSTRRKGSGRRVRSARRDRRTGWNYARSEGQRRSGQCDRRDGLGD